jgi:hypothetical protein
MAGRHGDRHRHPRRISRRTLRPITPRMNRHPHAGRKP